MAIQTKETLKTYFVTGAKPTEEQFATLIDSLLHTSELLKLNLDKATEQDALNGTKDTNYMTPKLTNQMIGALTRLANIPELSDEVDAKVNTAIGALMKNNDADSVIDTLKEVYDFVDQLNEEKGGLKRILDGKVEKADITDNLTTNDASSVLSARQGKVLQDTKEPKFSKNSAFNKDFGAGAGEVAEGNHVHKVGDLDGIMGASNRVDINREDYLATSQAVYRVNDKVDGLKKLPSWYNEDFGGTGRGENLLNVVCAGTVSAVGNRTNWWGRNNNRVGGILVSFHVRKITSNGITHSGIFYANDGTNAAGYGGQYLIIHNSNLGSYGVVANVINITNGGASKCTIRNQNKDNFCVNITNNGLFNDERFNFILFDI